MPFDLALAMRNLREVSGAVCDQIGDPAAGLGDGGEVGIAGTLAQAETINDTMTAAMRAGRRAGRAGGANLTRPSGIGSAPGPALWHAHLVRAHLATSMSRTD